MTDNKLTIQEALAELPDTADRIAEALAEQGIKGRAGTSTHCPIANYLKKITLVTNPMVGARDVLFIAENGKYGHVDLPDAVRRFVAYFDANRYPDLWERNTK